MIDIEVLCRNTDEVAVPDVYVALHRADTKARISYDYSDDSGLVIFPGVDETVNDGSFELRIGSVFPVAPLLGNNQSIQVTDENAYFEVRFNTHNIAPPTDNRLCRLEGLVVEPSGVQSVNNTLTFKMLGGPSILSGTSPRLVSRATTSVQTNNDGTASVTLIRCGKYSAEFLGMDFWQLTFTVPDVATANLADVLRPRVSSVRYTVIETEEVLTPSNLPTLELSVGDSLTLRIGPLTRYGLTLDSALVSFSSSDTDVARVTYQDGILSVTAVSAGSCTVTPSKVSESDDYFPVVEFPTTTIVGILQVTVND